MPFLYLPDAVSLLLLLVALTLLRSLAVTQIRQELVALRNEILLYWSGTGRPLDHPAHTGLRRRIGSRIEFCDRLTPACVFWTYRFAGSAGAHRYRILTEESVGIVEKELQGIMEKGVRKKILRFNLDGDVSFGTFYLLGSVSGWIFAAPLFFRIIIRVGLHKSGYRVDRFFDIAERVLSRAGRQAHLRAESIV